MFNLSSKQVQKVVHLTTISNLCIYFNDVAAMF